jgi:hypothetical protein
MSNTYSAVQLIVNNQPYIFSVLGTDHATNQVAMLNVVSGRSLGDTFPSGATISAIGPCTLNSGAAAGASKSVHGAIITDPQNNVVAQIPWVDPETAPINLMSPCSIPVGLNFAMNIQTSDS